MNIHNRLALSIVALLGSCLMAGDKEQQAPKSLSYTYYKRKGNSLISRYLWPYTVPINTREYKDFDNQTAQGKEVLRSYHKEWEHAWVREEVRDRVNVMLWLGICSIVSPFIITHLSYKEADASRKWLAAGGLIAATALIVGDILRDRFWDLPESKASLADNVAVGLSKQGLGVELKIGE